MEIDAFLCDHAEVADSKLFVNGAGIDLMWAASPQPPYFMNVAVAALVHVPYTATNQVHRLELALKYEDGDEVRAWQPPGAPVGDPVKLVTDFNVGRPPTLAPGDPQHVPLSFLIALPVANLGGYSFVISVQDQPLKTLSARMLLPPQQQQQGWGPSALPRIG